MQYGNFNLLAFQDLIRNCPNVEQHCIDFVQHLGRSGDPRFHGDDGRGLAGDRHVGRLRRPPHDDMRGLRDVLRQACPERVRPSTGSGRTSHVTQGERGGYTRFDT